MSLSEQECVACGDKVLYLATDGRCDGCVAQGHGWWTTKEVADYLGVKLGTVSAYHHRGEMPRAEERFGRTYVWRPRTITEWNENRPRRRHKA